ncbi:MAG: hypothetical protein AB3N63_00275 [Puniceicoccaceae bacterium]
MRLTANTLLLVLGIILGTSALPGQANQPSEKQLEKWLKRFPEADANGDGVLTAEEAKAYRGEARANPKAMRSSREMNFHPGWDTGEFPDSAVYKKSPEEILSIYKNGPKARGAQSTSDALSFQKPTDGGMRIVGVGHSFMAPAYRTLPLITRAAGFEQPLCLHTSGGATGSARYKWEQENGIHQFDGKPVPKLLAAISNYEWEAWLSGPYHGDRPEFYTCWIDFCLKYNPDMKFYISDAWPQLYQLGVIYGLKDNPDSDDFFTNEVLDKMNNEIRQRYFSLIGSALRERSRNVFIIPTSDAITEAAKMFNKGKLPGVEGIHKVVGGKDRSIWRDVTGHLGPGFDRLEGYVFYATLYGKSPELITEPVEFADGPGYPGKELDKVFRKIAWKAVTGHPLSGVKDENNNLIGDHLE